jgi:hypothetical protein
VTNNRLFIGNIPRTITPAALKETLAKEVAGEAGPRLRV